MKKKLVVLSGFVLGLAPVVALAQVTGGGVRVCDISQVGGQQGNLQGVLCKVNELLSAALPVLIALGVLFFVWGVITYLVGGDEEAKKKGRDKIIYGIIGLAVIIGMWGLVKIVTNTFGVEGSRNIGLPTAPSLY